MTEPWPVLAVVIASVAGVGLAAISVTWVPSRLIRTNHAGRGVPAVLGFAFAGAVLLGAVTSAAIGRAAAAPRTVVWVALAALGGVFLAGVADDLAGGRERGILGHLRSLARMRPTTGVLKLIAGLAAGVAVAGAAGGGPDRMILTALLVAVATNVGNALDVMPGRALKWGALVLAVCLPFSWGTGNGLLVAAAFGAAAGVLPFDLLERGMLGDAGSNPLGFAVGASLALVLPTPGLVVATGVVVLMQVAAETVTISRLIEAVPPVRWFDALGRLDDGGPRDRPPI